MAKLKTCSDCGKEISKKAAACPHCGANKKKMGCFSVFALIGLVFFVLILIGSRHSNTTREPIQTVEIEKPISESQPPEPVAQAEPGSPWIYLGSEDALTGEASFQALVISSNYLSFDFPYRGERYAYSSPFISKQTQFLFSTLVDFQPKSTCPAGLISL